MINTVTNRNFLLLAMAATAMIGMAEAHGRGGCHNRHRRGWLACSDDDRRRGGSCERSSSSLRYPRRSRGYNYNRRHRRDAFDLVSDIFSMPFYSTTNSLFRQHQQAMKRAATASGPSYDISENDDGTMVQLTMEVPGVLPKDLAVDVEEDGSILRIRGKRGTTTATSSAHDDSCHDVEKKGGGSPSSSWFHQKYYEFDQSFQLDEGIDWEKMSVTLSSGILTVTAPKKMKDVPVSRRIPISVKEEQQELVEPTKLSQKVVASAKINDDSSKSQKAEDVKQKDNHANNRVDGNQQKKDDGLEISEEEDSWQ